MFDKLTPGPEAANAFHSEAARTLLLSEGIMSATAGLAKIANESDDNNREYRNASLAGILAFQKAQAYVQFAILEELRALRSAQVDQAITKAASKITPEDFGPLRSATDDDAA